MEKLKYVVVTGGPGAGKTAVLEMARVKFCEHCVVLPEAASMIFSGGFWRMPSLSARMAAQRAIFHVQDEMEKLVDGEQRWKFALCDRGTLDGLAYWPGREESFWPEVHSQAERELAKYSAVIHMRVPNGDGGYNYQNILRRETPDEAHAIDKKIESIWSKHPNYVQVPNFPSFWEKAAYALDVLQKHVPQCCSKVKPS